MDKDTKALVAYFMFLAAVLAIFVVGIRAS
jgi:hypothetical protein